MTKKTTAYSFTEDEREWVKWFAWRPVAVYGLSVRNLWRPRRWVWMRWVEWTDTRHIGRPVYRLPEPTRQEDNDG